MGAACFMWQALENLPRRATEGRGEPQLHCEMTTRGGECAGFARAVVRFCSRFAFFPWTSADVRGSHERLLLGHGGPRNAADYFNRSFQSPRPAAQCAGLACAGKSIPVSLQFFFRDFRGLPWRAQATAVAVASPGKPRASYRPDSSDVPVSDS